MSVALASVERINALKNSIEATTGETYADLTQGVQALKDGYRQGGSECAEWINNNLLNEGKPKGALFCNNKEITVIPETFDFSQLEEADFLFYNCINLEEIKPVIDFSRVHTAVEWLTNCGTLKEIRFVSDTIGASETLVEVAILSPLLSAESISSILMGYVSGAITTLCFDSNVISNFTDEHWEIIGNKGINFM